MYTTDQKRRTNCECLLEDEGLIELVRYQWKAQNVYNIMVLKYEVLIKRIWEKKDDLLKVYKLPETVEMKGQNDEDESLISGGI